MALRLILMSVVAGMGLNLPTQDDVNAWYHTAEKWVNARFDDWDAKMPVEELALVFEKDAGGPSAKAPVAPVVSDESFRAVVGDMAVAFAKDVAPAVVEKPAAPVVEEARVAVVEAPLPITGPLVQPEALESSKTADRAFDVVMSETVGQFAADVLASRQKETADKAFVAAVDHMASSFAAETSEPEARPAVEPPVAAAPAAEAEDRLTHAMRLTREAVFAWAGLLHGPAVVTISR